MLYKLSVNGKFSSAHALREYKGKCENLHGHNWKVRLCIAGSKLDDAGMLLDFTEIKKQLNELLLSLDHKFLNETEVFASLNPTAENIAAFIFIEISKKINSADYGVFEVEVWESENSSATVSRQ